MLQNSHSVSFGCLFGLVILVGAFVDVRLLWLIAAVFSALMLGSVARFVALRGATEDVVRSRMGSLKVWWTLTALLAVSILLAPVGVIVLLALASCLGLNEYRRFVLTKGSNRIILGLAFGCLAINYLLIGLGAVEAFVVFLPLAALLLLAGWRSASGTYEDYIRSTGGLHWGMLFIVYGLSHAALLFTMPVKSSATFGHVGWFLFLVILTESNDIAQALVGRRIGKHKITPRVSPNKSWEGFLGGLAITVLLAVALAPFLTPLADREALSRLAIPFPVPYFWAGVAGTIIAMAGFLGDINMSAIKRDVGVKDGSSLLPGQGGVIDRIDSLTFTAPVFYYFLRWLAY